MCSLFFWGNLEHPGAVGSRRMQIKGGFGSQSMTINHNQSLCSCFFEKTLSPSLKGSLFQLANNWPMGPLKAENPAETQRERWTHRAGGQAPSAAPFFRLWQIESSGAPRRTVTSADRTRHRDSVRCFWPLLEPNLCNRSARPASAKKTWSTTTSASPGGGKAEDAQDCYVRSSKGRWIDVSSQRTA